VFDSHSPTFDGTNTDTQATLKTQGKYIFGVLISSFWNCTVFVEVFIEKEEKKHFNKLILFL